MSDSNTPSNPEVPQVPDVPQVPTVPQVPDIPRSDAGTDAPTPPPAYGAPTPPPAYGAPTPPPAYGAPTAAQAPAYGAPYAGYGTEPATKQPILSILALVAGIVGILGAPVVFIPIVGGILGLFIPAAAVILGFLGKSKEPQAKGFWLTGLITGFIGVGLALISIVAWAVLFASVPSDYSTF